MLILIGWSIITLLSAFTAINVCRQVKAYSDTAIGAAAEPLRRIKTQVICLSLMLGIALLGDMLFASALFFGWDWF